MKFIRNYILFICVIGDFLNVPFSIFNENLVSEKDKGLELTSCRYTENRPYIY